jgi:superfamily II DNA or RNA helicase
MAGPAALSTPMITSVPERGQLVEVRRRHWIVADVIASQLRAGVTEPQHLVDLQSIDDDALDETLRVIWQIEPGARIVERAGLPEISGYDPADRMEAFIDAVRWGAANNADRSFLQAPFRSGVSIESYQLDPLVRAIDMARVNLLIADDVGLGKTIEAGLVVQEMLIRHRARTVFVICPPSLQLKWQTEMQEKFGLEFRIVDTEYVKRLRREQGIHANPWTSFPRIIASIDWMKAGEPLRLIKDVLPPHVSYPRKFDILIIDEAHNVAPAIATRYALESQRTSLVRRIAPHFEHRIFLSATPHNGYQPSFTSLLELLDDQRFSRTAMPDEKQLQRVRVRRLKSDLVDAEGRPIYPKREIKILPVRYSAEERKAHDLLQRYAASRSSASTGGGDPGNSFILNLLKKRLFSSPRAFATTLEKHRESLTGRRRTTSRGDLDERILRKAISKLEEDAADDRELEASIADAVDEAGSVAAPLTPEQRTLLDELATWANTAKSRPDSKAAAILAWLEEHIRPGGKWGDARVILFTEYLATHSWLYELLAQHGFGSDRLMELRGGMDPDESARIKAAFQASPAESKVRILLATDAASEGIDLQNHCNFLIHVEIPWNPNVMEQRNGRIDRHGQRKNPIIWHPVGTNYRDLPDSHASAVGEVEGDHEYLMRAVMKVEAIREDLGSVGPVIAQQIIEAMSGKRKTLDTRDAETTAAKAKRFVAAERQLREKIAKLHERLMEAREGFQLTPERICRVVQTALSLAGKPALKPIAFTGLPPRVAFEVPIIPGWEKATEGLIHPHTGRRRPIVFDHEAARGRDDVVLAHLNHRLVQMCLRILRAEVWAMDDRKTLNRVAVRRSSDRSLAHPAVIVCSRLVITGGNHHQLHEELTFAGGELKPTGFARFGSTSKADSVFQDSEPTDPEPRHFAALQQQFEKYRDAVLSAVEARSAERLKVLRGSLDRRKATELSDINTLLTELDAMLCRELEAAKATQLELSLWPEAERQQLRRDVAALHARLARVPEEKSQETAVIEQRYANPNHRTFPLAVIFVLPPT